jgi:hypothetical protein
MAYSQVQFVGYAINTGPAQRANWGFYLIPGSTPTWARDVDKWYPGNPDVEQDVTDRVQLMKAAVEQAASLVNRDDRVLKVFVAPEFFFRGPQGAYDMKHVGDVIGLLQRYARADIYKHWLFVWGTIIGRAQKPDGTWEIYNVAVVQKGAQGADGANVVMKEFKSGIDFISAAPRWAAGVGPYLQVPRVNGIHSEIAEHMPRLADGRRREERAVPYGGEALLLVDDIQIGLEICLDHACKRLRNHQMRPDERVVQLQIIPSAGMEIQPDAVVAAAGGLVFNCDGSYTLPGRTMGAHTDLRSILPPDPGSSDTKLSAPHRYERSAPVHVPFARSIQTYYTQSAGEVHVYPAMNLLAAPSRSAKRSASTPAQSLERLEGRRTERPRNH